jgi:hypothetical protein
VSTLDFDLLPRMLWELCDGPCGRRGRTLYALDAPERQRQWYRQSCYFDRWVEAGRPERRTA